MGEEVFVNTSMGLGIVERLGGLLSTLYGRAPRLGSWAMTKWKRTRELWGDFLRVIFAGVKGILPAGRSFG